MPSAEFQNIDFGFKYGTQRAVERSPIENGNFKIAINTGELFIDIADQRISIKDIYVYNNEAEIRAITNPDINRLYYSRDSHKIMAYDVSELKWVNAGGTPDDLIDRVDALTDRVDAIRSFEIIIIEPGNDLPEVGHSGYIYFVPQDDSDEPIYDEFVWVSSLGYYENIGSTTPDLSNYYNKSEVDNLISESNNYTDTQKAFTDQDISEINSSIVNLQGYISTINDSIEEINQSIISPGSTFSNEDLQHLSDIVSNNKIACDQANLVLDNKITQLSNEIESLDINTVPKNHATSTTDFGIGSTGVYGHVKLSDSYTSNIGDSTDGIAASQKAVFDTFRILENNKTPIYHSSASTDYGTGNSSYFGHVKLSDSYNSLVGEASDGIGASQKATKDLYDYISSLLPHVNMSSSSVVVVDYGNEDENE